MGPVGLSDPRCSWAALFARPLAGVDGLHELGPVAMIKLVPVGADSDRVLGLDLAADGYVTEHLSPRRLMPREYAELATASTRPPAIRRRCHPSSVVGELNPLPSGPPGARALSPQL